MFKENFAVAVLAFKHKKKMETFEIDDEELESRWEEWVANGTNPHMKGMTFAEYNRPLRTNFKIVETIKDHFIYSDIECLLQSDDCPVWVYDYKEKEVEVRWIP